MSAVQVLDAMLDISIHALREEGDDKLAGLGQSSNISIHALREEGDQLSWKSRRPMFNFYPRPPRGGRLVNRMNCPVDFSFLSTPSARRATGFRLMLMPGRLISIHALREEGDCCHTHQGV